MKKSKIFRLIKGYLLYNVRKTMAIVLMLSLIISTYILINQSFDNIKKVNISTAEYEDGSWHFRYKYCSEKDLNNISTFPKVKRIGSEWVLGEEADSNLLLLFRDEEFLDMDPSLGKIVEGRLPQAENEIALTQSFFETQKYNLDDTIDISYQKNNYETGENQYTGQQVFKIVGVVSDYDSYAEQPIGMVSELFKNRYEKNITIENVLVVLANPSNIKNQTINICQELELEPRIFFNDKLIFAIDDNSVYSKVNQLINLIIWIISGLLIYNVLYFNYVNKREDLGTLRGIGFKNGDLFRIVLGEVMVLCILSIPLGFLIGKVLNLIFFKKILNAFLQNSYNGQIAVTSVVSLRLLIQVLILLSITIIPSIIKPLLEIRRIEPIDIINKNESAVQVKTTWWIRGMANISRNNFVSYGIKNMIRNKKRTYITICSLVFSAIVICLMIFLNGVGIGDGSWVRVFVPGDIQVTTEWDEENSKYFTMDTFEEMQKIEGIQDIEAIQIRNDIWGVTKLKNINMNSQLGKSLSKDILEANTSKEGEEKVLSYNVTLFGVNKLSNYAQGKSEGVVIDKIFQEFTNLSVGDSLELKLIEGSSNKRVTVEVVAVVDAVSLMSEMGQGLSRMIIDEGSIEKLIGSEKQYNRFDIWLEDSKDVNPLMEIKKIPEVISNGVVETFEDRANYYLELERNQMQIQYVFIIILAVMAMANVFNTVFNNMINRENEIHMLNCIGIRKKELQVAMLAEGIGYAATSVSVVAIVQIVIVGINYIFKLSKVSLETILIYVILDIMIFLITIAFTEIGLRYIIKKVGREGYRILR